MGHKTGFACRGNVCRQAFSGRARWKLPTVCMAAVIGSFVASYSVLERYYSFKPDSYGEFENFTGSLQNVDSIFVE